MSQCVVQSFSGPWCLVLLPRKEMYSNDRAREKLDFECARLRSHPTWDEEAPREWDDVAKEAQQQGKKVHFARRC